MKDLLRRAQPSRFEDLAAMNALYRPGALTVGMVEEYIQRKLGKRKVSYVLPETSQILRGDLRRHRLPGAGDADRRRGGRLQHGRGRRAAQGDGQEEPEVMAKQKQKFVDGAAERGVARQKARRSGSTSSRSPATDSTRATASPTPCWPTRRPTSRRTIRCLHGGHADVGDVLEGQRRQVHLGVP